MTAKQITLPGIEPTFGLSGARLDAIDARCEAANPGPWKTDTADNTGENWLIATFGPGATGEYGEIIVTTDCVHASHMCGDAEDDAEFVAHARRDVPDLVDEVRRLRCLLHNTTQIEAALIESLKLQSHYASLLNAYDGGQRLQFDSVDAWLIRLGECAERRHESL